MMVVIHCMMRRLESKALQFCLLRVELLMCNCQYCRGCVHYAVKAITAVQQITDSC